MMVLPMSFRTAAVAGLFTFGSQATWLIPKILPSTFRTSWLARTLTLTVVGAGAATNRKSSMKNGWAEFQNLSPVRLVLLPMPSAAREIVNCFHVLVGAVTETP